MDPNETSNRLHSDPWFTAERNGRLTAMDNDVMDTGAATLITVEWYTVATTTYRHTIEVGDLELSDGETVASVLAWIASGETPYIAADTLVDYEDDNTERSYDCSDRAVSEVTIADRAEDCEYPNCRAPHSMSVNGRKLCREHGDGYQHLYGNRATVVPRRA